MIEIVITIVIVGAWIASARFIERLRTRAIIEIAVGVIALCWLIARSGLIWLH